jgi:hypothetical protein
MIVGILPDYRILLPKRLCIIKAGKEKLVLARQALMIRTFD